MKLPSLVKLAEERARAQNLYTSSSVPDCMKIGSLVIFRLAWQPHNIGRIAKIAEIDSSWSCIAIRWLDSPHYPIEYHYSQFAPLDVTEDELALAILGDL